MEDTEASGLLRQAVGVDVLGDGHARGRVAAGGVERRGLFGGQMVAQSLAACAHLAPAGAVPDSIHVNLLGSSRADTPVDFEVERVRDGRALQHRDVRGRQGDALVLQATVVSSVATPGQDWQRPPTPAVGEPDVGPDAPRPWASRLGWGAFEVAHPAAATAERPSHPLWLRATEPVGADAWSERAVIAFWSDFGMNWSAREAHAALGEEASSVSATHAVWFHRRTDVTDWHLFDVHTQSLAGNQGFVQARLFDRAGRLVASVDQGVFIRRPAPA